ncbi:hypothetical protein JCM15765_09170 [Paradesulfitobacterium aromaticivorans]
MREKIEFDFLSAWERQQARAAGKRISRLSPLAMAALIVGTLIILVGAGAPWLWEYKLDQELAGVNQKLSGLSRLESKVQQLTALQARKNKEEQLQAAVKQNTKDPGPLLAKLSQLLPTGAKVSSFSLQGDNTVNLSVTVPTPVDVARLWSSLRDSGLFQDVDIKSVSLEDKEQQLALTLKLKTDNKPDTGTK